MNAQAWTSKREPTDRFTEQHMSPEREGYFVERKIDFGWGKTKTYFGKSSESHKQGIISQVVRHICLVVNQIKIVQQLHQWMHQIIRGSFILLYCLKK